MSLMVRVNDLLPKSQLEEYSLFDSVDGDGLPENTRYIIVERYCENPSCDCNSLIAEIIQMDDGPKPTGKVLATIHYDWSYKNGCYPKLDDESPKTEIAKSLLKIYKNFIHDDNYMSKIKNHYAIVKKLSSEKMLRAEMNAEPHEAGLHAIKQKVGRNDACPCGSNKKYKKCCLNK